MTAKSVAKSLHARGLEPGTFRAADAYATNKLQGVLGIPASIALFKPAPYNIAIV